ncbi:MAG: hypothetical protein M0Q49_02245 [Porticoccaceae bacterium]|jgi:hypothetical protein|nr:hypothetical protein [Porticoccaceae bacterium]
MAYSAKINGSAGIDRIIGRVQRLRASIEKANGRGNTERAASLQAEHDRLMGAVESHKQALDAL